MTRRVCGGVAALLVVVALLFVAGPRVEAETPPGMVPFEIVVVPAGSGRARLVPAWERDGALYLGANEISAMLGLVKFWRPELGRLILAGKNHKVTVIEGTDVALVDDGKILHLPGVVFLWEGQMMVPLDLFVDAHGEPRPWVDAPLVFSKEARRLRLGGDKPSIRFAAIAADSTGWTLRFESTAQLRQELGGWGRSECTIRLLNVSYDPLLLPLPTEHPWFQGLRLQDAGDGVDVRFTPGAGAAGFRVTSPDTNVVAIRLGIVPEDVDAGRLSAFASSGVSLPRFRRIVLDPGHGGADSGDQVSGGKESELAWKLARMLRDRLEDDLDAEVLFTREEKENPGPEARADAADRSLADLFLSLHIHGREGGPAAFLAKAGSGVAPTPSALDDLGFKPFGEGQAPGEAESRVVALAVLESVAGALEVSARGIHTELIPVLAGVSMPAMLLELGTDPRKKWSEDRLRAVAEAVADGIRHATDLAEEDR